MFYNANLKALNLRHSKNYSLDDRLKPIKSALSRFCCNKAHRHEWLDTNGRCDAWAAFWQMASSKPIAGLQG